MRYLATITAWVHAETEEKAIKAAKHLAAEMNDKHDNQAKAVELYEAEYARPCGTINLIKDKLCEK